MQRLQSVLFFVFLVSVSYSQTITSQTDGPWNDPATWAGGIVPDADNSNAIVIAHTVTVTGPSVIFIDGVNIITDGNLVVQSGAIVTVLNGTGDDLTITGTGQLNVSGTLRFANGVGFTGLASSNTNFLGGSEYYHLYTSQAAALPIANWDVGSTLIVTGWTSSGSVSTTWDQNFGNVDINIDASVSIFFNGNLRNIAGNLTMQNSNVNPATIFLSTNQIPAPTISVGGNFTIAGNASVTLTNSTATTLNVDGDFIANSSLTTPFAFIANANSVVSVLGNVNISCPALGGITFGSGTGNVTLNLEGNFNLTSGRFIRNNGSGRTAVNFNGTGTRQFNREAIGTNIQGSIDFNVSSSTLLDIGTSVISGNGDFVLNGTLALGSTSVIGAIPTQLTLSGTTYNSGATIIYNGSSPQIANGHPSSVGVHAIIDNGSGVSISGTNNIIVGGDLTLLAGSVSVSGTSPQLTVNGSLVIPSTGGNLIIGTNGGLVLGGPVNVFPGKEIQLGASSDLTINGSGSFGVFPFPSGTQQFRNFTLNRSSGNVTFSNDVTLTGSVTLAQGNLIFDTALTFGGTLSSVTGRLLASGSPSLTIISNEVLGTLLFDPSGSTLSALTMNGSGSATIGSPLTVLSSLNLLSGVLDNQAGITVADQLMVTRNSNGQLFGLALSNAPDDMYDVSYTGSALVTGNELPTDTDDLRNIIVEGGPVELSQNITVNGNVQLNSGFLNGGVSSITMNGPLWNFNGGEYQPETSLVIFTSQTEIQGTSPSFGSIELEPTAEVTLVAQELVIFGDLLRDPLALFDLTNKTVSINGFDSTRISLNGSFVRNINVNKSSAAVRLLSELNLTGTLDVQTPVTFLSNGYLTLISTSDGPEQNANIASLLFGAEVLGDVTVQRYMSGEGRIYRYLSSPVMDATVQDWKNYFPITGTFSDPSEGEGITSTNPSLFYYDETLTGGVSGAGWIPYPATGFASENPLIPGVGYAAFIRLEDDPTVWRLTGEINQGTFDFDITYTDTGNEDADGYNLIGNPYPSTVDWSNPAGWDLSNVGAVIAIKNNGEGEGNFVYSDDEGFPQAGLVATGQAFWILATGDDPTLSINESAKVTETGAFYREREMEFDALEIVLTKGTKVDQAYVRTREGALKSLDRFDAPKLQNDFFSLSVVAEGQSKLALSAVDALACGDIIPLDLRFPVNNQGDFIINPVGTYEFGIKKSGILQPIKTAVFDHYTDELHLLNYNQPFSFSISSDPESYAADRFELRILETEPQVGFAVTSEGLLCNAPTIDIALTDSELGVSYFLVINNQDYPVNYPGSGGEMVIRLPENQLQLGENSIGLRVTNLCGSMMHTTVLSVDKAPIYLVTESSATTICNEGISILTVEGGADGSVYNWYESASAVAPLHSSNSATFETAVLNSSTVYYVGIENEKGCEGNRTPIAVNVVNFVPAEIIFIEPNMLVANHSDGIAWYLNGTLLTQNQKEITILESGLYRLEVTVDVCLTVNEQLFIITGIENPDQLQFEVYPNPALDRISIKSFEIEEVQIKNQTGQQVLRTKLKVDEPGELDISHLPSGVYIISGRTSTGRLVTARIIKL